MTTEPTARPHASRHPYSTRGLSLRVLLLGAMLTSLAIALAGGQPVGAMSSGGGEPASDSMRLSDGSGANDAPRGQGTGGTLSHQASDGPPTAGVVPAASASPGATSGGWAGGPPDDWHQYHHWTDPSWPDQDEATGGHGSAPLPARTAGGYAWDPPSTPPDDPPPPDGWAPTPGDPADPPAGTPTGSPTTAPAPDPAVPDEGTAAPSPPDTSGSPPDGTGVPPGHTQPNGAGPDTGAPPPRDPVAAGPDGEDLGLGETVDDPTPTPEPTATPPAGTPAQVAAGDPTPASKYRHTLIYSGIIGLALAAIGLTMVGLRRRRW